MANFLSDRTTDRLMNSLDVTEGLVNNRKQRKRRVIRSIAGTGIFDCIITENFDDEPDRYVVSVYKNLDGLSFQIDEEEPIEKQVMLIKDASGKPVDVGRSIKCQVFTEEHDAPIGTPPDPQTDPPTVAPFATSVYRPLNLWRWN